MANYFDSLAKINMNTFVLAVLNDTLFEEGNVYNYS